VRDLVKAGAPRGRRITNNISTFWFKVRNRRAAHRHAMRLPLLSAGQAVNRLRVKSQRYAYELEVMVKAAWAGVPLVAQPVSADYAAATSRLSHFDPWRDMARISRLHSRLSMQAFCVPALLRKIAATGELHASAARQRVKTILRLLFSEHTDTPAKTRLRGRAGIFLRHRADLGISNHHRRRAGAQAPAEQGHRRDREQHFVSAVAPFIMAGGLLLGHYLHTGALLQFNGHDAAARNSRALRRMVFRQHRAGNSGGPGHFHLADQPLFAGENKSPA
jgi:hypothetical protein